MVRAADPVFGIQHTLHTSCGPLSDAVAVPRTRTEIRTKPEASSLRMGGTSEERPSRDSVLKQRASPSASLPLLSENVTLGDTAQCVCNPPGGPDGDCTAHRMGHLVSPASDNSMQLARQRCLSYDASLDRSGHWPTRPQGRDGSLFRHSMSNIPNPSLPFPATRQQKQAAITALKKPLQVVTKEKSLIRYTNEGRRYWRWKDVVARVLHICRGASADDYSLLLQTEHWLEACDNKHRYGSNLKPYFKVWLVSDTHQSFFKWLDEGEGMHLDIPERPRKKLDLERVVYCGIERCFFEVSIDKGMFRYQISKVLVTTDSARNDSAPPCPPDLGKTMASIRQSTMRSGRMLSPWASGVLRAHQDQATSSQEAAASASLPTSPPAGVGHAGFCASLGASAESQQPERSERHGASGCSLSDDLQQVTGRSQSPAERAVAVLLDEAVHSKGDLPGVVGFDSGSNVSRLQSQNTPPRISGRSSVNGMDGGSRGLLRPEVSDATVQHFSPAPGTPPIDDRDAVSSRHSGDGGVSLSGSAHKSSLRPSQRTPGLLSQELRKVAGNPRAQLGEEVGEHITSMKQHSTAFLPPSISSSPPPASTASPVLVPTYKRPPVFGSQSVGDGTPSARVAVPTVTASHSGEVAPQQQQQGPQIATASPNDMEDYLHWAFGRTPAQILQRPIVGGHAPVYTEDQHAGGWLDTEGQLHMRRHGVNSLPSGLTRFPSLTLMCTQRFGHGDGHSDEDSESLPYGRSIGGSSDASGSSPVFSSARNSMRHHVTLPASVSAHSMRSPVTATNSMPPLPRGFPSMPRLGTEHDGTAHTQRFPAMVWTLRFPNNSTPDGTIASNSGDSSHGPNLASGALRQPSHLGAYIGDGIGPLPSLESGAFKETAGALPQTRRMSDSDGNVFHEAHQLSLLSSGMHITTIGPHMRTPSVGTAKELQVRRLRSSLDSRVDVSHPRLVSNSAIPVNLKLLDIVETVAAPGGGSSVASAPQAGSYGHEAGEHIGAEGGSGSIEPEVRDLADMLEERMERTGQLVKVRTQKQLEDLLPCAPKVLGRDRDGDGVIASGELLYTARTNVSTTLAESREFLPFQGSKSSRPSSTASLPPPPVATVAVASLAAGPVEPGNAPGSARSAASSILLQRPATASRAVPGPTGDAAPSSQQQPAPSNSRAAASSELLPDPAAVAAPQPSVSSTFHRISEAAAAAAAAMPQTPAKAASGKDGAAPVKDAVAPPEKAREKWIYVWDMHSRLYINRKMPGRFHHSSFVAGGAVKAAGSIVVEDGVLRQITTWSGHYRPRLSDISAFLEWLKSKGVNMETVELLVVKPHKPHKAPKPNQQQQPVHVPPPPPPQ